MNAAITFVAYFNRAPQFITDDEIRFYLRYQSEIRRLKSGSMGIIHGMLKFLYAKTLRIERPDRIVMHTDQFRVVEVDMSEGKSAFIQELEHFRDAVLGKSANTLTAADAVRMTELIESIRAAGEK